MCYNYGTSTIFGTNPKLHMTQYRHRAHYIMTTLTYGFVFIIPFWFVDKSDLQLFYYFTSLPLTMRIHYKEALIPSIFMSTHLELLKRN